MISDSLTDTVSDGIVGITAGEVYGPKRDKVPDKK